VKITVLLGGTSSERDVSLASGLRVVRALRERGHEVTAFDTAHGALTAADEHTLATGQVMKSLPPDAHALARLNARVPATLRTIPETDVVFLGLHGGQGEDGTVQALLDLTGVPYTGTGHLGSALAMDKDLSKRLFRSSGVPTPDWLMAPQNWASLPELERHQFEREVERTLQLPVIVKPSKQGSTVGLTLARNRIALREAITEAFNFDDEVMVEQFIPGRELTVGILGDTALPVGEIIPAHEIYDYQCKYTAGMAREVFPADLTPEKASEVQRLAVVAFHALKLRGYARIDFRMSPQSGFFCLEANTLPGMTELSLIPQAAAAAGISFAELCERIVRLALNKRGNP
jgi:D-alanine-D-alanine ligase